MINCMPPTMQQGEQDELPVGFKFVPTDVELINYYLLRRVVMGETHSFIHERDVYAHAPWDLNIPQASNYDLDEEEEQIQHYCFSYRRRTGQSSKRVNRNSDCGLWDRHGRDIVIRDPADPNRVIGHKVQFNFKVVDDQCNRTKTSWIMHEYRLESEMFQELVLCRIYEKKKKKRSGRTDDQVDHQAEGSGVVKRQRIENQADDDDDQKINYTAAAGGAAANDMGMGWDASNQAAAAHANCSASSSALIDPADDLFANMSFDPINDLDNFDFFNM